MLINLDCAPVSATKSRQGKLLINHRTIERALHDQFVDIFLPSKYPYIHIQLMKTSKLNISLQKCKLDIASDYHVQRYMGKEQQKTVLHE